MEKHKIKKHFSLNMVQKTLDLVKNQKNQNKNKASFEEKSLALFIPKFLDPLTIMRLEGDIAFLDKLVEEEIGIFSVYNNLKTIKSIDFIQDSNHLLVNVTNKPCDCIPWNLIYERLLSLGDVQAYELATELKDMKTNTLKNISKIDEKSIDFNKLNTNYDLYYDEMQSLLKSKKNAIYFYTKFGYCSELKTIVCTSIGFSNELIKIIFDELNEFTNYLINFSLFDFLTIDKNSYFEYIKTCFKNHRNEKNNSVGLKFQTVDGLFENKVSHNTMNLAFFDGSCNTNEMLLLTEFNLSKEFFSKLGEKREKKTRMRLKKTQRENEMEKLIDLYYSKYDLINQTKNNEKDKVEKTNYPEKKQCGYRLINHE